MCKNCGARLNGERATVFRYPGGTVHVSRVCADARACNRRRQKLHKKHGAILS